MNVFEENPLYVVSVLNCGVLNFRMHQTSSHLATPAYDQHAFLLYFPNFETDDVFTQTKYPCTCFLVKNILECSLLAGKFTFPFFPLTGLIQRFGKNTSMDCCLLGKIFIHNAAFGLQFFLFVPEITLHQLSLGTSRISVILSSC